MHGGRALEGVLRTIEVRPRERLDDGQSEKKVPR